MRGYGVLRHVKLTGDLARRNAVRFVPHQQTEYVEAGWLEQVPRAQLLPTVTLRILILRYFYKRYTRLGRGW